MSKNFYIKKMGEKAKLASSNLSSLSIEKRNSVLKKFCEYLKTNSQSILKSNKKDILNAQSKKIKESMIDRLKLDSIKISQIKKSI
jgi:glutamate-5-semialdehyde dehydrogenase